MNCLWCGARVGRTTDHKLPYYHNRCFKAKTRVNQDHAQNALRKADLKKNTILKDNIPVLV